MPQPPKFRYSLKTADNTAWYYINSSGAVATSATAKYLVNDIGDVVSPKEWDKTQIGLSRDDRFFGVFTKFNIPINFTLQAADIIKYLVGKYGYEGTAILVVDINNDTDWTYSEIYRCELDLSTATNNDYKERGITVTASELSLVSDLKNKSDIVQELAFDADALTINHDGIGLDFRYKWVAGGGNTTSIDYTRGANLDQYIDSNIIGSEDSVYVDKFIEIKDQIAHTNDADSEKFVILPNITGSFKLTCAIDIQYEYKNSVTVSNSNVAKLQVLIREFDYTLSSPLVAEHVFFLDSVGVTATGVIPSFPRRVQFVVAGYSFPMTAGRTYKLSVKAASASSADVVFSVYHCDLTLTGATRLPASFPKAYPYLTFLNKLFKAALGSSVNVLSDYLGTIQNLTLNYDNPAKWTTVTSGDALRGLTDPKIKCSISQAFQDMRRWQLGVGIEGGNIRVERLPYFFQKDRLVYTIDSVREIRWSIAQQYLGNSIKTGYDNQTYDQFNGKYDFFNSSQWNFPTRRIKKELDWVSPMQASPWAIEYTRTYALVKKDSTDSQYDNQTFLIDVDGTPVSGKYNLLKRIAGGRYAYGFDHPETFYNFGLSPATTLRFNAEYLLSMGYGKPLIDNDEITWQTNDKNANVGRQIESIFIQENGNIPLQTLQNDPINQPISPLFQPILFEVEAALPISLFTTLKSDTQDKYGVIRFPYYSGGVFKGMLDMFIMDVVFLPATKGIYVIKGLSSPNNDLSIL